MVGGSSCFLSLTEGDNSFLLKPIKNNLIAELQFYNSIYPEYN